MSVLLFEFVFSLFILIHSFYFIGLSTFIYLTNLTLILHVFILFELLRGKSRTHNTKILFSIGWSVGWVVVIMFWLYVYPLIDIKILPPFWNYVSTHGIIHLFIVHQFFNNQIKFENFSYVKWPLLYMATYLFAIVLPLKFFGIIIYPLFFDEFLATFIILFTSFLMMYCSFYSGYYFSSKFKKLA